MKGGDKPPKALDTQLAIFQLSVQPFHHATLRHLNMPLRDMIQASGTACTLFWHPEKPWHVPRPAMCSITLPKDSPRNLDQPQCHALPYIVSRSLTLEWCVPCAPSCLKFYLSYKLFPSLNSCFYNFIQLLLSIALFLICDQLATLPF